MAGRLRRWGRRGETVLIAVTEKDLAALNLWIGRAAVIWRKAERADGLATRMQRATEAMAVTNFADLDREDEEEEKTKRQLRWRFGAR